jgi:flagellar hook-associated protein 3 FlgL
MRVTFNSQYRDLEVGIGRAAETLLESQRQVSSGKRIARPSDDPTVGAYGVTARSEIAQMERYTQATDNVTSRLTVVDTILSDIGDRLSQARTIGMGASGSVKTPLEREAAVQTLIGLRDAILDDLNTSFNGINLFAGTASTTKPYESVAGVITYQGTADEAEVDVADGRTVKVTYDGESIARGSAADDVFAVFDRLVDAIRGNQPISIESVSSDQPAIDVALGDLRTALERVSTVQTRVGTQLKTLEDLKPQLSQMKLQAQTRLDQTENVDLAEAISGMTQAETAYRAALGAAGTTTKTSLMDFIR